MLNKKYEDIDSGLDSLKETEAGDKDSNFYQWSLLQEEMVAREITSSFRKMKTKTLKNFDRLVTKIYIENLYSEFKRKSSSLKQITVEDKRLYDSLTIPIVPIRKKIPSEFKAWFSKTSAEDELILNNLITPTQDESKIICGILDKNQMSAATTGGKQAFYELGIGTSFKMINVRMIEWGKNYDLVLSDKVSQSVVSDIKFSMLEGLQNREGIPELRQKIVQIFDKPIPVKVPALVKNGKVVRKAYVYALSPEQWSTMVARSETIRWAASGKLEGYRQSGIVKKVRFIATGDHRTCDECSLNDGVEYTLEEAQGVIPLHCQGRCTWGAVISEKVKSENNQGIFFKEIILRRIKNLYFEKD